MPFIQNHAVERLPAAFERVPGRLMREQLQLAIGGEQH
jgi:hypothetical protein